MAQELRYTQELQQELEQQQRLNIQQVMMMRLLEMPITQLEQNVQAELDENPALEVKDDMDNANDSGDGTRNEEPQANSDNEGESEEDDVRDELEEVLDRLDRDDRMETSNYERQNNNDPDALTLTRRKGYSAMRSLSMTGCTSRCMNTR